MSSPPPFSPYTPPVASLSASPLPSSGGAARLKVFGILHLIFGVLGILVVILMVFISLQLGTMQRNLSSPGGGTPESEQVAAKNVEFVEKQLETFRVMEWSTAIPSLLIIPAGILLLCRRKTGLHISNAYAITSILTKLVICYYFYRLSMSTGGSSGLRLQDVAATLATCVYPLLALFLLNSPAVKQRLSASAASRS